MRSVLDVASWFLFKDSITHKKLQKLCYYAQAWHCALLDIPLFGDRIEAWVHGPVIPSLYSVYAEYGWRPIPQITIGEIPFFKEDSGEVLKAVYGTYGGFTGDQLEALTHSEAPWIRARGNLEPLENCTKAIAVEDMREYYKREYELAQND